MKKFIPIICISIVAPATAKAQDPAKVDPGHYKIILDNSQVRILDIHQKPGDKSPMHSHPNHVVYSLNGETLKFTLPDGRTKIAKIRPDRPSGAMLRRTPWKTLGRMRRTLWTSS